MDFDSRIDELQLELPEAPSAVGIYRPAIVTGNLCYTSGHLPMLPSGEIIKGCVGKDATQDDGYQAARQCGLTILATLRSHFGTLNKIKRLVKVMGFVNCSDDFYGQPAVVNGCSELFKEVFGDEAGIAARSAVGSNALPLNVMVEVEAIFEIES